MKAIVIHGAMDLRNGEVPTPEPREGQVRLRMAYGGICGSDLHYWHDGANGEFVVREPLVPGHEMSGTVDLDPSGSLATGTPVTIHPATFGTSLPGIEDMPHLWPNGAYLGSASTTPHTQGGMSEFMVVEAGMLRVLPDSLPLRRAALAEPLAVALHGIALAGGVEGKTVLVSGSGPIGLLAAAAALAGGASEVTSTDVLRGPLQRAVALGVHRVVQVSEEEIPARSFDVVLECSGVPAAVSVALLAAKRAGQYVQLGMLPNEAVGINLAPMISGELTVHGSFRFNDEIDAAITMLDNNPGIEDVITHEISAEHAEDAFVTARNSEISGKVLISLWRD